MSREDFKKAVRAGKLSEAFLLAISKAPELRITTWIATPEANTDEETQANNSLQTQINLVAGEINNVIGEGLISNRHPEIERVHFQEVERANDTIQENLATVQKMLHSLAVFQQESFQSARKDLSSTQNPNSSIEAESPISNTSAQSARLMSEFDEAESVVDDMLSLADIDPGEDVETDEQTPATSEDEDWGDWLVESTPEDSDRSIPEDTSEGWQ